jgi:alpha-1,2-mannosyltransferase
VASSNAERPHLDRIVLGVGVILVALGLFVTAARASSTLSASRPFDFDVNWVAAHRLIEGRPLYDTVRSRAEAETLVGPEMRDAYRDPFTSYIGLPVVALVHAPFAFLNHDDALRAFRLLSAVGMLAALALVARTLTPGSRLAGFAVGFGVLLLSEPALWTLGIGQGNALVMGGFAVAIWASERGRWRLAGMGAGLAAALKLSPALFLVYFALRGKWRAARWGAGTVVALSTGSAIIGRPGDLLVWAKQVLPLASAGSIYTGNQSVVGWVGRVLAGTDDLAARTVLGPIHYLGVVIAAVGTVVLWRIRRRSPLDPLELGALILVILVAGPLSWDHYFVWAAIPVVSMTAARYWRGSGVARNSSIALTAGAALLLLSGHVRIPDAASVHADWSLRLTTTPYALSGLMLLACAIVLIREPLSVRYGRAPPNVRSMMGSGGYPDRLWVGRSGSGARVSTTSATSTSSCRATS